MIYKALEAELVSIEEAIEHMDLSDNGSLRDIFILQRRRNFLKRVIKKLKKLEVHR